LKETGPATTSWSKSGPASSPYGLLGPDSTMVGYGEVKDRIRRTEGGKWESTRPNTPLF
jgi:hypothetical protein